MRECPDIGIRTDSNVMLAAASNNSSCGVADAIARLAWIAATLVRR